MENKEFTRLLKKAAKSDIWNGTKLVTLGDALFWGYTNAPDDNMNEGLGAANEYLPVIEAELQRRAAYGEPLTAAQKNLIK